MRSNRKWLWVLLVVFLIHLGICIYAVVTYEPGVDAAELSQVE